MKLSPSVLPFVLLLAPLGSLAACGANTPTVAPPRASGCEVETLREGTPTRPVTRAGGVVARCTHEALTDDARCLRELQDQVCRLGGDVIWDIRTVPLTDEAREMRGVAGVYQTP